MGLSWHPDSHLHEREIMGSGPVRAKKALGQHFLTSEPIAARIAGTISPGELPVGAASLGGLPILEIGPGTGMLTQYLEMQGRALKAVELDVESVAYLHAAMPELDVVEGDFLKMNPADFFGAGQFALIGNYPYNISSQIFFKVLENRTLIPICAGMLQREVAQRICAVPGSRTRGILSVLLQAWYDCEYLFTVDENNFSPPPKVKSGVLRLIRNSRTELGVDEKLFKTIVKQSFGQRRKTLRNSLASLIDKEKGSDLLADPMMLQRPECLSVDDFISLTAHIASLRG